jgi:hypothetical protein
VDGGDVGHDLAQVVEDAPAHAHTAHDAAEVLVQQHQARSLARHVGAAHAHGDADVRGLQRGRVVDAVTRHRHVSPLPGRLARTQLVLGHRRANTRTSPTACRRRIVSASTCQRPPPWRCGWRAMATPWPSDADDITTAMPAACPARPRPARRRSGSSKPINPSSSKS